LLGDAIPISGLSPDSPLYDSDKAPEARRSLDNALWLCKMCARRLWKEIEGIPEQVQADYLLSWKEQAEQRPLGIYQNILLNYLKTNAFQNLEHPTPQDLRSITRTELALQDMRKCSSRLRWKKYTPDQLYEELIDSLVVYTDAASQYSAEVRCFTLYTLGEFAQALEVSHYSKGSSYVDYEDIAERICVLTLQLLPALEPGTQLTENDAMWMRLALENIRSLLSVTTGHFYSLSHALNSLRSIRAAFEKVTLTREVIATRNELQDLFDLSLKSHDRSDIELSNEFMCYIRYLANGTRHPDLRQQLQLLRTHTDKERVSVKPLLRKV
jgi:hypothetical protein